MPELYTVAEAAQFLRVSRQAVYGWIDQGLIRAYKYGEAEKGHLRIPKESLDAFLEASKVTPKAQ